MRRLISSTLLSLDGVIGDPTAWVGALFDERAARSAGEQLLAGDAMLMGRRTYEIFSALWSGADDDYAAIVNTMRKYVFSSTLDRADWQNTTIIREDPVSAVAKLKAQDGKDLIMYGHGQLGAALLDSGLFDELRFAVHPVMVGRGATLLREEHSARLELLGATTLDTGVVVLRYRPAGSSDDPSESRIAG